MKVFNLLILLYIQKWTKHTTFWKEIVKMVW